jgi:hypothetical protein
MSNVPYAIGGASLVLGSVAALVYAVAYLSGIDNAPDNALSSTSSSDPAALTYTGIVAAIAGVVFALLGIRLLIMAYRLREPIPSIRPYLSTLTLKQEVPKPMAKAVIALTLGLTTFAYLNIDHIYNAIHDTTHLILKLAGRKETSTVTSPTDYRPYLYNHTEIHGSYNFTFGIKLEKPSSWLDKEPYQVRINDTTFPFETQKSLPQNGSNSTYRAFVLVHVEGIPKNMSLDVFTQVKIKNIQTSQSFHLITSNSTTLSGNPAHQIVFTYQSPMGKDLRKEMQIWTLKDGKAYVIEYSAVPGVDKFSVELPVVKHIVNSFQITQ